MTSYLMNEDELIEVRTKRYETLIGTWRTMPASNTGYFKLCPHRIDEIIEHYLENLRIIKLRYKIPDEIQLHKIAGLMTYSIVKFKPVSLTREPRIKKDLYINESLAVLHGLSICAEYTENPDTLLYASEHFDAWYTDFLYLLHKRNFTAECLAFAYETICLHAFPANFNVTGK